MESFANVTRSVQTYGGSFDVCSIGKKAKSTGEVQCERSVDSVNFRLASVAKGRKGKWDSNFIACVVDVTRFNCYLFGSIVLAQVPPLSVERATPPEIAANKLLPDASTARPLAASPRGYK